GLPGTICQRCCDAGLSQGVAAPGWPYSSAWYSAAAAICRSRSSSWRPTSLPTMPPTTAPMAAPVTARLPLPPAMAAPAAPPVTAPTIVPVPCLLPGPQAATMAGSIAIITMGASLIASPFDPRYQRAGPRLETGTECSSPNYSLRKQFGPNYVNNL